MKIAKALPLADAGEEAVRAVIVSKLEADPEWHLTEYARRFGNVLNADNAATLFAEYNESPATYRVAVHPAAQWIRDELFRRALAEIAIPGSNRVVFTAGGNASGKSTAIDLNAVRETAHVVFDSTFSNPAHARSLVDGALNAGKAISIFYVNRPLDDALDGMMDRADIEGRVVTIEQLIRSQRGAAATVRSLWSEFGTDPRFSFIFMDNSSRRRTHEAGIETAAPQDYTENRRNLNELLDAAYKIGRISEFSYKRIRGRDGESGKPSSGQA